MRFPLLLFAVLSLFASAPTGKCGLTVRIPAVADSELLRIAASGSEIIHALATYEDQLASFRAAVEKAGLQGIVSADLLAPDGRLPYAPHLINALYIGDEVKIPEPEIERVLAPGGMLYSKSNGKWKGDRIPLPDGMDVWTHWDYNAGGNSYSSDRFIAPTTSLRWIASPTCADAGGTKVGMRIAGGRVYYIALNYELPKRHKRGAEAKNHIICRDAFNGTLIWRRDIEDVHGRGDNPPRFALTATETHVFAIPESGGKLHALDAKTGDTLTVFDGIPTPPALEGRNFREIAAEELVFVLRVVGDQIVSSYKGQITCADIKTGKRLWQHSLGNGQLVGWMVAGDGKAFAAVSDKGLIKNRASPSTPLAEVVAIDLKTGEPAWKKDGFSGHAAFRICYHNGSLVVPAFPIKEHKHDNRPWLIQRLDGTNGEAIWTNNEVKGKAGGHYTTAIVHGDELLVGQQGGFALDFETGKFLRSINWGQHDNSCADLKCVPGWSMYGLTFVNAEGERIIRGQNRSICDTGNFPAYGMLYGLPSACLCAEYINGHLALAADKPLAVVSDESRLTRGPAKVAIPDKLAELADGWPMHLGGPERGSYKPGDFAGELTQVWQQNIAAPAGGIIGEDWADNESIVGPASAATVAGERVFVAATDRHQVQCRNVSDGKLLWAFTTGGRVDSPPTLVDDLCIFGCRDGSVYCLRAADGAQVWKFFAGRYDQRVASQSGLESTWPIHGSVMYDRGGIVFTAGRQSALDGGIQMFKLDPYSGSIIWRTRLWTDPDLGAPSKWQWRNRRLNDLLVSNGKELCLWITPFDDDYTDGREVEIFKRVYPARAVAYYKEQPQEDIADATWLRSANNNGLLSRRVESVGRHDGNGVSYAKLNADKIAITPDAVFAVNARAGKPYQINGGLVRVARDKTGKLALNHDWKAGPFGHGDVAALAVGGDRAFATFATDDEAELRVVSTGNGETIQSLPLPTRPVRDGIALADGRIFVTCRDGSLTCFGHPE